MDTNDWLKQLLLMGIGTTSLVAEKFGEASEQWVKDGKINPDQAKAFVDDLLLQIKTEQDHFETNLERQLRMDSIGGEIILGVQVGRNFGFFICY